MIESTVLFFRAAGLVCSLPFVALAVIVVEMARQIKDAIVVTWRGQTKKETPAEREIRLQKERQEKRQAQAEEDKKENERRRKFAQRQREYQIIGGVQEVEDEQAGMDIEDILDDALSQMPNQKDAQIIRTLWQKDERSPSQQEKTP